LYHAWCRRLNLEAEHGCDCTYIDHQGGWNLDCSTKN
jgi:hypothetical protein